MSDTNNQADQMSNKDGVYDYDVIIFGAGASGLALASELSKSCKVLVFDKKKSLSDTTKSWLIPDIVINEGNATDLFDYMIVPKDGGKRGVRRFLANTFTSATVQGANIEWDSILQYQFARDHDLLEYWGKTAKDNKADILLDCWYQDSFLTDSQVTINTSKGEFVARLLIDASGGQSPIRSKYSAREHLYWWSVSGAIVKFPNGLPEGMRVGDYQLWQTFVDTNADEEASLSDARPVWEYEILDENTAFVFIFYLGQFRVPQNIMSTMFNHVLKTESTTSSFRDTVIDEIKYGWYPSGGTRSQQVTRDRVVFVGSAGCWTSPCGWGMSYIIANYKKYAAALNELVKQDKLDQAHGAKRKSLSKEGLASIVDLSARAKYQILMDQVATHFLAFASSNQLNEFIRLFDPNGEMGNLGPLMCEKLFTLTITEKEAASMLRIIIKNIGIKPLLDTMPKKDYPLVVLLLIESLIAKLLRLLRRLRILPAEVYNNIISASGFSLTGK